MTPEQDDIPEQDDDWRDKLNEMNGIQVANHNESAAAAKEFQAASALEQLAEQKNTLGAWAQAEEQRTIKAHSPFSFAENLASLEQSINPLESLSAASMGGMIASLQGIVDSALHAIKMPTAFEMVADRFPIEPAIQGYMGLLAEQTASFAESLTDIPRMMNDYLLNTIQAFDLQGMVAATLDSIRPQVDFSAFIPSFNFDDLWADLEEGESMLEEHGYGFSREIWSASIIRSFAGISVVNQASVVTRKIAAFTRQEEFVYSFISTFEQSRKLKKRINFAGRAIDAHTERDYIVSIPLLLIQLEGCINELLLIKGLAGRKKTKFYKTENRKQILNKNGDPMEMKGLHEKASRAIAEQERKVLVDLILNRFAPMRNGILHGVSSSYNKAKTSTQLVLLVGILADMIMQIE